MNKANLFDIKNISKIPIFDIGKPGSFDENGVLTCSVTKVENYYYFYYAGFELGTKIRYRLLSGLAITNDKFILKKKYNVPVLERSDEELYFRGGPFCIFENGIFKMWYVAGSSWININKKQMPIYEIKYMESTDGVNWPNKGVTCIQIENSNEHGFGRPFVVSNDKNYKMYYSIRIKDLGYRLGYAESKNEIDWVRKDYLMNLDVSQNDFDDKMICYSSIIEIDDKIIMFYNGNDFGKTGFGYAELVEK
ncbi:hypothetical protein HN827_03735 [archaeon]|nr:hypothetical protein [archaeon]